MSSLMEPSSLVLLIGAVCIFIFIIHGLWFSHKPQNRQLNNNNQQDQEIRKSSNIGKVRIVTADQPNNQMGDDAVSINHMGSTKKNHKTLYRNSAMNDLEDSLKEFKKVSISINHKSNFDKNNMEYNQVNQNNDYAQSPNNSMQDFNGQYGYNNTNQSLDVNGFAQANNLQNKQPVLNHANLDPQKPWLDMYEIILNADLGRPYLGEELEDICNTYGFVQGFVENNQKIYLVNEQDQHKDNEVFRICSMEDPYYFPNDMRGFKTNSLALYMNLPPQGKGFAYFKAVKVAAGILLNRLGGQMCDINGVPITNQYLEELSEGLRIYDEQQLYGAHNHQNNNY